MLREHVRTWMESHEDLFAPTRTRKSRFALLTKCFFDPSAALRGFGSRASRFWRSLASVGFVSNLHARARRPQRPRASFLKTVSALDRNRAYYRTFIHSHASVCFQVTPFPVETLVWSNQASSLFFCTVNHLFLRLPTFRKSRKE